MNIENRWYLLLAFAASAVVGAALAGKLRSGRHHTAPQREHADDLKTWENEGGNLHPATSTS